MTLPRIALALFLLSIAAPARADATLFIGVNTTPSSRATPGFSAGLGIIPAVAWEFEYAATSDELEAGAPSLKTGTGSIMLQTPVAVFRLQPYFEAGAGWYSEALEARTDKGFAADVGGGVKIVLIGPLRLRVDYRAMKLGSGALYSPAHRIYAGLNLGF